MTETEVPKMARIKASEFLRKDGKFSKTASFASAGTFLVLCAYVMSWFAGTSLTLGDLGTIVFPQFDSGAAVALLSILNGTYLANNVIKSRKG